MAGNSLLIIGGTSYIAKNFINSYSGDYRIRTIARKDTGSSDNLTCPDFFEIPDTAFQDVDTVINCAAIVHKPNIDDDDLYDSINFKLPVFLANKARENKCRHFIQLSTIAVYGDAEFIDPETEACPANAYGISKLKCDNVLGDLATDGFYVTCLRPSMVYGSKNAPGNLQTLIRLVKTKLPLPFGGIDNKRQFLHIRNLTQAMQAIIQKRLTGVILLADEETVSTTALVNTIMQALEVSNRNFRFGIVWKIIHKVKPALSKKLTGDLRIKNTYSFKELGILQPQSVKEGIREMV
jgi:UDP-glucose 4-epimerase